MTAQWATSPWWTSGHVHSSLVFAAQEHSHHKVSKAQTLELCPSQDRCSGAEGQVLHWHVCLLKSMALSAYTSEEDPRCAPSSSSPSHLSKSGHQRYGPQAGFGLYSSIIPPVVVARCGASLGPAPTTCQVQHPQCWLWLALDGTTRGAHSGKSGMCCNRFRVGSMYSPGPVVVGNKSSMRGKGSVGPLPVRSSPCAGWSGMMLHTVPASARLGPMLHAAQTGWSRSLICLTPWTSQSKQHGCCI